jgi:hypothetical protein
MTAPSRWAAACCGFALVASAAACGTDAAPAGGDAGPEDRSAGAGAASPATYSSDTFSVPFDVEVPSWLPADPSTEESHFVTWESTTEDRKVRMLVPVSVYVPGEAQPTPPPSDYLAYLRTQEAVGASFTDETTLEISGRSATVLTATTDRALDGDLGCHAEGMAAVDCWGLQPELLLRIAVIPLEDSTLVAWSRAVQDEPGTDEQFADFDAMVASLELR